MSHIMLSYQWDIQPMVKMVYSRLYSLGYNVWMDIEEGMSGSINDAMAAAVEDAFVVVPFMTTPYQGSKNCKKELNYTDSLDKNIIPCMAERFKPSGWLGIITAGMLWMDFRNPDNLDKSIESLIRELNHLFGAKVVNLKSIGVKNRQCLLNSRFQIQAQVEEPEVQKGRAFVHVSSGKYFAESGNSCYHSSSSTRNDLVLRDDAEDTSFWAQESKGKGTGIVFFKNYQTHGYLGYDPNDDCIYTKAQHCAGVEWRLMTDDTEETGRRAVVIFAEYGKKFLTVVDGKLHGVTEQTTECRWYLDDGSDGE